MRQLELRRHARRDPHADRLSAAGRAQAEDVGRAATATYDVVFVSPAQRAAETAAWFLRGAGQQLPDHEVVPGLGGQDATGGAPDGMAAGVRALLERVPDGGRGLAISHTPLVERPPWRPAREAGIRVIGELRTRTPKEPRSGLRRSLRRGDEHDVVVSVVARPILRLGATVCRQPVHMGVTTSVSSQFELSHVRMAPSGVRVSCRIRERPTPDPSADRAPRRLGIACTGGGADEVTPTALATSAFPRDPSISSRGSTGTSSGG